MKVPRHRIALLQACFSLPLWIGAVFAGFRILETFGYFQRYDGDSPPPPQHTGGLTAIPYMAFLLVVVMAPLLLWCSFCLALVFSIHSAVRTLARKITPGEVNFMAIINPRVLWLLVAGALLSRQWTILGIALVLLPGFLLLSWTIHEFIPADRHVNLFDETGAPATTAASEIDPDTQPN